MSDKLPRARRARKSDPGSGTPAPKSIPLADPPTRRRTNLRGRERAFQESDANRRVWELVDMAREWRELHLEFKAWLKGRDPADEILLDYGIVPPSDPKMRTDFADDAVFVEALEGFDTISAKIRGCTGLMCGELPCRPAKADRRGKAVPQ